MCELTQHLELILIAIQMLEQKRGNHIKGYKATAEALCKFGLKPDPPLPSCGNITYRLKSLNRGLTGSQPEQHK